MSYARVAFLKRVFREKYGVRGTVAGLYLEAGYSITFGVRTRAGHVGFIAVKGEERLAVDVVSKKVTIGVEVVKALKEKAEALGAKPVLVLYGAGPKLSPEAVEAAKSLGVSVRRVRAGGRR